MGFLPRSQTLSEHLASASREATVESWNFVRAGLRIRLDLPNQTELRLRRCATHEEFVTTNSDLADTFS